MSVGSVQLCLASDDYVYEAATCTHRRHQTVMNIFMSGVYHWYGVWDNDDIQLIHTLSKTDQTVSDRVNGTSTHWGYTVPFTLVHAGKYRTEDKSNTDNTETKHNPEKANNAKHSKTKLVWFSRLIQHSARNEVSWACSTTLPSPHRANWPTLIDWLSRV